MKTILTGVRPAFAPQSPPSYDSDPEALIDMGYLRPNGFREMSLWLGQLAHAFRTNPFLLLIPSAGNIGRNLRMTATHYISDGFMVEAFEESHARMERRILRLEAQARSAGLPDLPEEA